MQQVDVERLAKRRRIREHLLKLSGGVFLLLLNKTMQRLLFATVKRVFFSSLFSLDACVQDCAQTERVVPNIDLKAICRATVFAPVPLDNVSVFVPFGL